MSLIDLIDRKSIIRAIKQFDSLGREKFLKQYGFRKSGEYLLEYKGKDYDSKAIVGVAHRFISPRSKPMSSKEFSGGEATVKKKLEDLEFKVKKVSVRKYWALQVNPKNFDIDNAIKEMRYDHYFVNKSDVRKGDRVLVWRSKGGSGNRGIVALGEIISDPTSKIERKNRFWLVPPFIGRRAYLRIVRSPKLPLWMDKDKSGLLKSLTVASGTQGTVFRVTEKQWKRVVKLAGGWVEGSFEDLEAGVSAFKGGRASSKSKRGQGFLRDTEIKNAIEQRAMREVEKYFKNKGWAVEDVSGYSSYDLLCTQKKESLYVEVKGTTTDGSRVILTENEINFARENKKNMCLAIVSEIKVTKQKGRVNTTKGKLDCYYSLSLSKNELALVSPSYWYSPDGKV